MLFSLLRFFCSFRVSLGPSALVQVNLFIDHVARNAILQVFVYDNSPSSHKSRAMWHFSSSSVFIFFDVSLTLGRRPDVVFIFF